MVTINIAMLIVALYTEEKRSDIIKFNYLIKK